MPIYLLTALKVPKGFMRELDKARRRFLWVGDQEYHGGKCKVNWPTTCCQLLLPAGGLGILDLERFGRALRLRWLWFSWTNPEKPWSTSELPVDNTDRALFAAATRVRVNNGKKALFWHSSWLDGHAPITLFPQLYRHSRRKKRTVYDALTAHRWIKDIAHNLTNDLLSEFFVFWTRIDAQNLNLDSQDDDQITWTPTATGIYSAKSAYNLQLQGKCRSPVAKAIWKPWGPNKCKLFLWLLLQNRIWTADRLMLRERPNSYFCPLCYRNLETAFHLVAECPFSKRVWSVVATWPFCSNLSRRLDC